MCYSFAMDANYINNIVLMLGDGLLLAYSTPHTAAAVAIRKKPSCKRRVDKICKTNCYTREPCLCPPYRGRLYFIVGHFEYPYRSAAARSSSTAVVRVPPPSVGKVPISFSNAMVYLTWNMNAGQRDDFCKGVL